MWPRESEAVPPTGPLRAEVRDIGALNRLFSEAFTERYRRDGLTAVRVPHLNTAVWRYAIEDADAGAMVWHDERGDMVAFTMVHRSGTEGWMGPLAVRTDHQGGGFGRVVVSAGIDWLEAAGVRTIGLETMPRTLDNIGFYSRLGFRPGPLTITLHTMVPRGRAPVAARLGEANAAERDALIAECRALSMTVADGVDFTRELELTLQIGLGDASLLRAADGELSAFVLWHVAPLAADRRAEDLRVLKLVARDLPAARAAIHAVEAEASVRGLEGCAVRCQTRFPELYRQLVADEWRVHWTDLRLTLEGYPEPEIRGVMLSNWEI